VLRSVLSQNAGDVGSLLARVGGLVNSLLSALNLPVGL
jgi:hypothetical protein